MDADGAMDITNFKASFAILLGRLEQIDPLTGEPYVPARYCKSFAEAPMSLAETDLPTWVIFTGGATYPNPPDQTDERFAKETRDFQCRLYVGIAQTGQDGERERVCQPYVDPARQLIQSRVQLYEPTLSSPTPGIMRAYLIRDDGVTTFPFNSPGVIYMGLRFVVRVEADNEVIYDGNQ
jgi:hypothetical protein